MANWYYYNTNGKKVGPISVTALKSLVRQGLVTRDTVIENHTGRTAVAGEVNGLSFPESPGPSKMPAMPSDDASLGSHVEEIVEQKLYGPSSPESTARPVGPNPFVAPPKPVEPNPFVLPAQSVGPNPFVSTSFNPFTNPASSESPFMQSPSASANIPITLQPVSAELLGMKPELFFLFMYLGTLFSFSIVTIFIPIVLWALTKDKDKRADIHGKTLIAFIIAFESCYFIAIVLMLCEASFLAFPFAVAVIGGVVWLIAATFYSAYGYVPTILGDIPGATTKTMWVYMPTPADAVSTKQSPSQSPASSPVDEIKKMKELLDCGAISLEEFNTFKKKALGI